MTVEQLKQVFHERGIRHVKLGIFDVDGVLRAKYVSPEKFFSAAENGLGFCDVIFGWDSSDALYDNVQVTGWHTGYHDQTARVDPSTFRVIPWERDTAFLLLDMDLPVAPRTVLRHVEEKARARGGGWHPGLRRCPRRSDDRRGHLCFSKEVSPSLKRLSE